MNKRFGLHVELRPDRVEDYVRYHRSVWPEVEQRFERVGFCSVSVFLKNTTVFLLMEYSGDRSLEEVLAEYGDDPKIQEWEAMNGACKQAMPGATDTGFEELDEIYRFDAS